MLFISEIPNERNFLEPTDYLLCDNPNQAKTYKISCQKIIEQMNAIAMEVDLISPRIQQITLSEDYVISTDSAPYLSFNTNGFDYNLIFPIADDFSDRIFYIYNIGDAGNIIFKYDNRLILTLPHSSCIKVLSLNNKWIFHESILLTIP